ncbi:MAG: sigma-54-dependent Fis family transcriptional regulator [Acidobacteriota bacterium]|nr:sigma-54-dependent Fis family transcriptional regulator [Acidobacteriota bacterium]
MSETQGSILVVDDEPSMLRYLQTLLEVDSYNVSVARSGVEAIRMLRDGHRPDLVILDLLMPNLDGLQTLEQARQIQPGLKVVMLSCVTDTRKVAQAIKLGAQDYLTKPFKKAELDAVLGHCLASSTPAGGEVEELSDDQYFVTASASMRKIRAQVAQLAQVDVPVLMLGESGTGKEVVARLIHKLSSRANRTWMKINCAALPAELLESELFGYEPGAFTGANRPKPGKFELCDKGTFLLDEVGEMPPSLQAKLLHVLQDQQFSRLGSRSIVKVDVRILAATNIDIPEAIASRKFREDLYYRLNAFTIQIPPLRDRKEEIPLLIRHFMGLFAARYARTPLAVSPSLIEACMNYRWPGNLRELENFVKRYLILGDEALALMELETKKEEQSATAEPERPLQQNPPSDLKSLVRGLKDEAECEAISRALKHTKWNRKEAARMLKISYKALLYKIRQYNLDRA